jgi:hypothetical protein
MRTARKLEAEWRKVLLRRLGTGTKEDEPSTGCVEAAEFHLVTACSRLGRILKLTDILFIFFFGPQ